MRVIWRFFPARPSTPAINRHHTTYDAHGGQADAPQQHHNHATKKRMVLLRGEQMRFLGVYGRTGGGGLDRNPNFPQPWEQSIGGIDDLEPLLDVFCVKLLLSGNRRRIRLVFLGVVDPALHQELVH